MGVGHWEKSLNDFGQSELVNLSIVQSRLVTFPNVPMTTQLFGCVGVHKRCLNNEVAVTICYNIFLARPHCSIIVGTSRIGGSRVHAGSVYL